MKRTMALLTTLVLIFSFVIAMPAIAAPAMAPSQTELGLRNSTLTSKNDGDVVIWLNKSSLTLKKGKTATLKATIEPDNVKLKWKSTNAKVAKVSSTGKVTAVAKGTTWIYAEAQVKDEYKPAGFCLVTVTSSGGVNVVGTSDLTVKYGSKKLTLGKTTYKTASGNISGGYKYYSEYSYDDGGTYGYYIGSKNYDKAHTYLWFMTYKFGKMKANTMQGAFAVNKKSSLATNRGIKIGSTKKQVETKYGPYTEKETVTWSGKKHDVFYYTGLVKNQYITVRVAYLKGKSTVANVGVSYWND